MMSGIGLLQPHSLEFGQVFTTVGADETINHFSFLATILRGSHRILDRHTQEFYIPQEAPGGVGKASYYIGGFKWQVFGGLTASLVRKVRTSRETQHERAVRRHGHGRPGPLFRRPPRRSAGAALRNCRPSGDIAILSRAAVRQAAPRRTRRRCAGTRGRL